MHASKDGALIRNVHGNVELSGLKSTSLSYFGLLSSPPSLPCSPSDPVDASDRPQRRPGALGLLIRPPGSGFEIDRLREVHKASQRDTILWMIGFELV